MDEQALTDKKILIIDDDPDILEAIKIILEGKGYIVKTLLNFQNPKIIEDFNPKLILLDLSIGGDNGGEIAKKLKKNIRTKDIPIIILSAQPQMKLQLTLEDCGAKAFLQKPFNMSDLVMAVKTNCLH